LTALSYVTVNTGVDFNYQTVPNVDLSAQTQVEFSVMARDSAHVRLTLGGGGMFEIVLGFGPTMSQSTIRRSRAGNNMVESNGPAPTLSASEFRTFVLDWGTPKVLKVFSKSSSGALTELLKTAPQPESVLDVKTIAVSTVGTTGSFRVQVSVATRSNLHHARVHS
jgi:hypothetical protein